MLRLSGLPLFRVYLVSKQTFFTSNKGLAGKKRIQNLNEISKLYYHFASR
jgi:hypothetical protein